MRPEERSLDLAEVEQRLQHWAAERGYETQRQARCRGRWAVWQCQISCDGQPVPGGFGVGKGLNPVSRVGALAEATEHLISRQRPALAPRSAAAVADDLVGDAVEPLLREQPSAQLACTPYRRIDGGGEPVELPLGLSQPSYYLAARAPGDTAEYWPVRPYMTNSGTALGANREEALLHALNEVAERDALSLLICRAVWGGEQVAVLDPASLPVELVEQHRHVEQALAEPVHLLELTTDLGLPTVLAYIAPHAGRRSYGRGLGASLNPQHATSRALAELLQMEIVDGVLDPTELDPLQELNPLLHAAGRLDLTEHLAHAQPRPYRPCPAPDSVAEQLAEVTRRITTAGYRPRYRELDTGTSELAVVHVAVPGLERIMGLLSGYAALPGPRGLAAIHGAPEGAPA